MSARARFEVPGTLQTLPAQRGRSPSGMSAIQPRPYGVIAQEGRCPAPTLLPEEARKQSGQVPFALVASAELRSNAWPCGTRPTRPRASAELRLPPPTVHRGREPRIGPELCRGQIPMQRRLRHRQRLARESLASQFPSAPRTSAPQRRSPRYHDYMGLPHLTAAPHR